jgi:hypothetical protein
VGGWGVRLGLSFSYTTYFYLTLLSKFPYLVCLRADE